MIYLLNCKKVRISPVEGKETIFDYKAVTCSCVCIMCRTKRRGLSVVGWELISQCSPVNR